MSDSPGSFRQAQDLQSLSQFICQCLISMFDEHTLSGSNQTGLKLAYNNYQAICERQRQSELENYCNNYLELSVPFNSTYQNCSLNYLSFCKLPNEEDNNQKTQSALDFLILFCIVGCLACCLFVCTDEDGAFSLGWRRPPVNLEPVARSSLNIGINIREFVNRRINALGIEGLDELKVEDETQICVICLDKFVEEPQKAAVALECEHIFHRNCLLPWFEEHQSCPICRTEQFQGLA
jgi:hypothetical protein